MPKHGGEIRQGSTTMIPDRPDCRLCGHMIHASGRCRSQRPVQIVLGLSATCECPEGWHSDHLSTGNTPTLRTVENGPAAKFRLTRERWEALGRIRTGSILFCRVCVYYLPGTYTYDEACFEEYVHDECAGQPLHPAMMEAAAHTPGMRDES
jgi:hypothetical protein